MFSFHNRERLMCVLRLKRPWNRTLCYQCENTDNTRYSSTVLLYTVWIDTYSIPKPITYMVTHSSSTAIPQRLQTDCRSLLKDPSTEYGKEDTWHYPGIRIYTTIYLSSNITLLSITYVFRIQDLYSLSIIGSARICSVGLHLLCI